MLLLVAVLAIACGRSGNESRLRQADKLMMSAPDSALAILNEVDPTNLGEASAARYAVLLAHARYRNYLTDTVVDDSLACAAISYFTSHRDPEPLMTAWFCKAYIEYQRKNYTTAMLASLHTLMLADSLDNNLYRARAHQTMGDIWSENYLFKLQVEDTRTAANLYEALDMPDHANWEKVFVATGLSNMRHYDEAVAILDSIMATCCDDTPLKLKCIENLYIPCFGLEDYDRADSMISVLIKNDNPFKESYYSIRSIINSRRGCLDDGRRLCDSVLKYSGPRSRDYIQARSALALAENNVPELVRFTNLLVENVDSVNNLSIQRELADSVNAFYLMKVKEKLMLEEIAHKDANRSVAWLIVVIVACIALIVYIIILTRRQRADYQRIRRYLMDDIDKKGALLDEKSSLLTNREKEFKAYQEQMETCIDEKDNALKAKEEELKKHADDKHRMDLGHEVGLLHALSHELCTLDTNDKKSATTIYRRVNSIVEGMRSRKFIANTIKSADADTAQQIEFYQTNVSNDFNDIRFVVYILAGLKAREIALLMKCELPTVYTRQRRLIQTLSTLPQPEAAELARRCSKFA